MRQIPLFLTVIVTTLFCHRADSQPCTIGNPGVKLNYSIVEGANCKTSIDLYFDLKHNPGGKWFWMHIWPTASYSNWNYSNPPTTSNGGLTGSIATFGVEHQGTNLVVQGTYPPDPLAPGFQSTGLTVVVGPGLMAGSERYTVKNLVLVTPGNCTIPLSYTVDVWESQSAQSQNVHCFVKGMNFYANDPSVSGFLFCDLPRKYSFNIKTISNTDMSVNYKVFIDNGNGIFNSVADSILINSGTATLNAVNQYKYQSPIMGYLPYSGQKPYADRDLWVEVTTPAVPNAIYAQLTNLCAPLPVKISMFQGKRTGDLVHLQWNTVTELNNRGFYIERNEGDNTWTRIAFVTTLAINGNSNDKLEYQFSDMNPSNKVSFYRLCQVDIDSRLTYSQVISVRAIESDITVIPYPNPCRDDYFTYEAPSSGTPLKVRLFSHDGRLVREWVNNQTGRYDVKGIVAGLYVLHVTNGSSGEIGIGKIILLR